MVEGELVIEETEAKVIRQIFDRFLSGYNRKEIASELQRLNIPKGSEIGEWSPSKIGLKAKRSAECPLSLRRR
ncbi:MAG: recombinase family protein [Oscillospiraceae bacterium]|nr:recombinase family protein [Oscillospiraceae bacterium]